MPSEPNYSFLQYEYSNLPIGAAFGAAGEEEDDDGLLFKD